MNPNRNETRQIDFLWNLGWCAPQEDGKLYDQDVIWAIKGWFKCTDPDNCKTVGILKWSPTEIKPDKLTFYFNHGRFVSHLFLASLLASNFVEGIKLSDNLPAILWLALLPCDSFVASSLPQHDLTCLPLSFLPQCKSTYLLLSFLMMQYVSHLISFDHVIHLPLPLQFCDSFAASSLTIQLICCFLSYDDATPLLLFLIWWYNPFAALSHLTIQLVCHFLSFNNPCYFLSFDNEPHLLFLSFNDVTHLPLPLIWWHNLLATFMQLIYCLFYFHDVTYSFMTWLIYHLLFDNATHLPLCLPRRNSFTAYSLTMLLIFHLLFLLTLIQQCDSFATSSAMTIWLICC